MALRYYPHSGSPASGPTIGVTAYRYAWSTGGTPSPYLCTTDKNNETQNSYDQVFTGVGSPGPIGDTDNGFTLAYLLTTDLYIAGTIDIGFPVITGPSYQKNIVLHAYVSIGTSGGTRGTLLDGYIEPSGTNDVPQTNAWTGIQLDSPQTVTPVQAYAGDYVVVELGFIFRGPDPNNENVGAAIGSKDSGGNVTPDITSGVAVDIFTYSHAAWIEFALLPAPPPQPNNCPPCAAAPGTGPDPIGTLPPWTQTCDSGGQVDSVADLDDGEDWS
jgi:hypothetical protein